MQNRWIRLVLVLTATIMSVGCNPKVRVRQNPGRHDTGIRYYRPKPYLLIEPAESVVTQDKKTTFTPSDEFVKISLEYLPDFTEEYSIDVRPGLGSANVSLTLDEGWNLTQINQVLDSQFDENVKAVAELAEAASGFVPTKGGEYSDGVPPGSQKKWVVRATNVPIGYYESVINEDACGKKRMFGWRYLGFLPYSPCPTVMCGIDKLACQDFESPLYGIVFDHGVMTLKRLDSIRGTGDQERESVSTGIHDVAMTPEVLLGKLENKIRVAIQAAHGIGSKAHAALSRIDAGMIDVAITIDGRIPASRADLIMALVADTGIENTLAEMGDVAINFTAIAGTTEPETELTSHLIDEISVASLAAE